MTLLKKMSAKDVSKVGYWETTQIHLVCDRLIIFDHKILIRYDHHDHLDHQILITIKVEELNPSKLGTKEYWEEAYNKEVELSF